MTLTYGRELEVGTADHLKAACLTYSDIQRYLRAYRDYRGPDAPHGYPLRYWVVGEYGSTKGRAHWHCIVFWQDKIPVRPLLERFDDAPFWPHGTSYWDALSDRKVALEKSIRYAVKYVAKELEDDERQTYVGLSRYPALGDEYFRQLAHRYAEQGLAPQAPFYSFPEITSKGGKPIQFRLSGVSLETFLNAYNRSWAQLHGDAEQPTSDMVLEYLDSLARKGNAETARNQILAEKLGVKNPDIKLFKFQGKVKKPGPEDMRSWMKPERLVWSEKLHHWLYLFEGEQSPWYWTRTNGGAWSWQAKPGGVTAGNTNPIRTYSEIRAGS